MLFHVTMTVKPPLGGDLVEFERLKATEKARAQELQRQGKWRHLWRIAGHYANVSVFDVADIAELHEIISSLPLFPHLTIEVTPLCRHPSSIRDTDA
jgi:muconolactone D-isomerase